MVRIPFADTSLYLLPEQVPDEAAILLSDILPTGFEIGVQYGRSSQVTPSLSSAQPGRPVRHRHGRALRRRSDRRDRPRREPARAGQAGGRLALVNSGSPDWKEQVFALTDGYGVDVAIEASACRDVRHVHAPRAPGWQRGQRRRARQGGDVDLQRLWIQNINISMGLVNTTTLGCCSSSSLSRSCRSTSS
jgi:alcohol dehydrogenase